MKRKKKVWSKSLIYFYSTWSLKQNPWKASGLILHSGKG